MIVHVTLSNLRERTQIQLAHLRGGCAAAVVPPTPELALALAPYIKGDPGPAGGATLITTAQPISGHAAAALNEYGELIYADCTDAAYIGTVLGVTEHAYAQGVEAEVKTAFTLTHAGWSFTPGPVLVGAAGALVQTLPPGAVFAQVIGTALSATVLHIDLQPPIFIS